MLEMENTSVENQEVAELETESVENQEVAELETTEEQTEEVTTGRTEVDSAFAQQRRARQEAEARAIEAERKLAELQAETEARANTFKQLTGKEEADIEAIAEQFGVDADDVLATINANAESSKKDLEIERLKSELQNAEIEKTIKSEFEAVQKYDSSIKSIDDLSPDCAKYVAAGLSLEDAYFAVKAKEEKSNLKPPNAIGQINVEAQEKEWFTEAEVDAMTEQQQKDNADKILASMSRW